LTTNFENEKQCRPIRLEAET